MMDTLLKLLANENVVQLLYTWGGSALGWLAKRMTYTIKESEKKKIVFTVVNGMVSQANNLRDKDGVLSEKDKQYLYDQAAKVVNTKIRAKTPWYVRMLWKKSITDDMLEAMIEGCVKQIKKKTKAGTL